MKAIHPISGFTLLELVTVMAIILLLVGLFGGLTFHQSVDEQLNSATHVLLAKVQRAHFHALETGQFVRIVVCWDDRYPDDNLRLVSLVALDNGAWRAINRGYKLPSGVSIVPPEKAPHNSTDPHTFSVFSGGGELWQFDPDGSGYRSFLFVEFSPDGKTYHLDEVDFLEYDICAVSLALSIVVTKRKLEEGELQVIPVSQRAGVLISPTGAGVPLWH